MNKQELSKVEIKAAEIIAILALIGIVTYLIIKR
jgi:hypothetical protein